MNQIFTKVLTLLKTWWFPTLIALCYWLFDSVIHYVTPGESLRSVLHALFPWGDTSLLSFRVLMAAVVTVGAHIFEEAMLKMRKLEQQLYLSEYAVETTKAFAMIWVDERGRILKVNQHAAQKLGYSKDELLRKDITDIAVGHTVTKWQKLLQNLKVSGNIAYLAKYLHKDGYELESVVYLQSLRLKNGEHFQFSFACEAVYCDDDARALNQTCGHGSLPTFDQVSA